MLAQQFRLKKYSATIGCLGYPAPNPRPSYPVLGPHKSDSLNCFIFMLIVITHNMAINAVTNPYHSLEKIKQTHRKMFAVTNYMEQDPTKIVWLW